MRQFIPTLAIAAVAAIVVPAVAGDIIVQNNDRAVAVADVSIPPKTDDFSKSDVTVTEWNVGKIHYKLKGLPQAQEIATDKVKVIHFDPSMMPRGLDQGERLVETGQYAEGRELLAEVAENTRAQKWAREHAVFLIAESYWHEGNLAEAIKAYQAFLSAHSKSRHIGHATTELARAQMDGGDAKGARDTFKKLLTLPNIPESVVLEADYGVVWISEQLALASGDNAALQKAEKGYDDLLRKVKGKKGLEALAGKCVVGKASCQAGQGNYDATITMTEKLIAGNADAFVRAGAYTLLGRSLWKKHTGESDRTPLERARACFLKVVLLYGGDAGTEEYMAESLFSAGALFSELSPKGDDNRDDARMARLRAMREWRECVQRFPRSAWAKQAQQRLNRGG